MEILRWPGREDKWHVRAPRKLAGTCKGHGVHHCVWRKEGVFCVVADGEGNSYFSPLGKRMEEWSRRLGIKLFLGWAPLHRCGGRGWQNMAGLALEMWRYPVRGGTSGVHVTCECILRALGRHVPAAAHQQRRWLAAADPDRVEISEKR